MIWFVFISFGSGTINEGVKIYFKVWKDYESIKGTFVCSEVCVLGLQYKVVGRVLNSRRSTCLFLVHLAQARLCLLGKL